MNCGLAFLSVLFRRNEKTKSNPLKFMLVHDIFYA